MAFDVPAYAPVAEYLNIGSRSLLYFEKFEPRFKRAFGETADVPAYQQLHKRFYEQNGLNEDKLRNVAAKLQVVLQDAGAQLDVQRGQAKALWACWEGAAAEAAGAMLNQQVEQAGTDWKAAGEAWKAIAAAGDGLRSAVKLKADVVRYILENGESVRIAEKSPEDIDDIISGTSIAVSNGWQDDSLLSKLGRIFPDLTGGSDAWAARNILGILPGSDYQQHIQARCRHWLDNVFKPDYLAKVQKFTAACDVTDAAVKQVYAPIVSALGQVSVASYPRPVGVPVQQPVQEQPKSEGTPKESGVPKADSPVAPTVPASTTPAPSTPSSPSTPVTPSSPTVPASTTQVPATPNTPSSPSTPSTPATPNTPSTPATPSTQTVPNTSSLEGLPALSQVATQLSPLASGISSLVDAGVSSLTGIIKDGAEDAVKMVEGLIEPTPVDKDGDGKPDSKPAAEFDVAGKHLKFEMADGQLKLMMSDGDGKPQEFSVKLDEHGMPVISMNEPKDEATPAAPGDKPPADHAPGAPEKAKSPADQAPSAPDNEKPGVKSPAEPAPEQQKPVEKPHTAEDENAGQPSARTGTPPPMRREEDGEHRPKRMPGEQNPEAPFDTGAELAEAGPMGDLAEAGPL
ncbi:hypothetical protein [Nocardia sp. NPDC057030]|uniref:hypothetical protein n=1 Tax=unclassified Nocardia TaxID=2637762 RepID=UPI00363A5C94